VLLRFFGEHLKPIFSKVSHIAAYALSSPVGLASVFHAFSNDFEQQSLLGI
jgi:hypothetical protein